MKISGKHISRQEALALLEAIFKSRQVESSKVSTRLFLKFVPIKSIVDPCLEAFLLGL